MAQQAAPLHSHVGALLAAPCPRVSRDLLLVRDAGLDGAFTGALPEAAQAGALPQPVLLSRVGGVLGLVEAARVDLAVLRPAGGGTHTGGGVAQGHRLTDLL